MVLQWQALDIFVNMPFKDYGKSKTVSYNVGSQIYKDRTNENQILFGQWYLELRIKIPVTGSDAKSKGLYF